MKASFITVQKAKYLREFFYHFANSAKINISRTTIFWLELMEWKNITTYCVDFSDC